MADVCMKFHWPRILPWCSRKGSKCTASLQAHDVNATSDQRRYNVMTFMQRRINVGAT